MAATTFLKIENLVESTLDGAILAGDGTLDVQAGEAANFGAVNFHIVVGDTAQGFEIMTVTNVAGDTMTIARAAENVGGGAGVALPFDDGTAVRFAITDEYMQNAYDAINGIEDGSSRLTSVTGDTDANLVVGADLDLILRCDLDGDGANKIAFHNGADTEVGSIDESGNLQIDGEALIGGAAFLRALNDVEIQGTGWLGLTRVDAGDSGPQLSGLKSDAGAIVTDDAVLLSLAGQGHDGANYGTTGARIDFIIDGAPAADKMPTDIEFHTALGAVADDISLAMTIGKDKNLTVVGDVIVTGNTISNDTGAVIEMTTGTLNTALAGDLTVTGNTISNDTGAVIEMTTGTDDVALTGDLGVGGDLTVTGNTISNDTGAVIEMTTGTLNTALAGDLTVTGNTISNDTGAVIEMTTGTLNTALAGDLTVTGNTISNDTGAVIEMTTGTLNTALAGDLTVTGNTISNDTGAVIEMTTGTDDVALTGDLGVGGDLTVTGNTISNDTGAVIEMTTGTLNTALAGDLTVTGNTISNDTGAVIEMDTGTLDASFANDVKLSSDEAKVWIGTDHSARGYLYLFGDNDADSPILRMYNAANEDGVEDYWTLSPEGAAFHLGPTSDADEFIFENDGDFIMGGNLTVTGNNISDSGGVALTFDGAGSMTVATDLTIALGANQDYKFTNIGDGLLIQGLTAATGAGVSFMTADGDGTDNCLFQFWGVGTPGDTANRERLRMGWDAAVSRYNIYTEESGSGVLRPLYLFTEGNEEQLVLNTDGSISISDTIEHGVAIISHDITWDGGATQACATVADGYVVQDVYIEITTTFDGDAVVTVGDGGTADGFLTDAGINQGVAGYYGQDVSARGAYIANGDRKIYTGADTVDAFVTETTATQGAATVYVVIQRLK